MLCNIFVEKNGIFRPAGGEHAFCVSTRVTPVNYTTYAVRLLSVW